jgi:hypothetical protein
MKLTDKQESALLAVSRPNSGHGVQFWNDARARWYGPRKTLGSLERHGLVTYSHEGGWAITEAGEVIAEEVRKKWLA